MSYHGLPGRESEDSDWHCNLFVPITGKEGLLFPGSFVFKGAGGVLTEYCKHSEKKMNLLAWET